MKNKALPLVLKKSFNFYVLLFLISTIIFWTGYHLSIWFQDSQVFGDFFALAIISIALLGSYVSYHRSIIWGFTKSDLGKSLIFISLALLMWALGEIFYFIDSKTNNPLNLYDFFFIFIDPFYLIGVYFISKAIGTFKNVITNINLLVLPVLILILNYLGLTILRNQDPFTAFLNLDIDTIYIIGSVFLSTFVVSLLLFSKKLGGIYKHALQLILVGLLCQYIGDNLFEIYPVEKINGSLSDLIFFMSISFVTFGVLMLNPNSLNEKRN